MLKKIVLALLLVASLTTTAQAARPLPTAKIMAVYVTADWCPNCKILGPALQQAINDGGLLQKPVLFVTLNLTDKPHIRQAIFMAQALGIGPWLQSQGSATGYVAVIDSKTKAELVRFDKTNNAKAIMLGIEELLNTPPKE
jgi:thiol-disulfide isomerase/thioredoxin